MTDDQFKKFIDALIQNLSNEASKYANRNTRDAIHSVAAAIAQTAKQNNENG